MRTAIASQQLQLVIVGPKDKFKASRIQRANLNAEVPNTTVDELGNSSHAGVTRDIPNVTLSFEAFDTGVKIFSALTGSDPASYPAGGVDISNLGQVDAILYVKDDALSDYSKSIHARKMQVQSASYSFSLDGEASESYNAQGAEKRQLKYDVQVDKIVTGTTSFTLTQTPRQLKNGNYCLSVILDGKYLLEVATGETLVTGQYSVNGTTVTTFDTRSAQFIAVYHANPAGTNWVDVSDSSMPAGVKGKDVKLRIAANDIARVQSISINANLNPVIVKEMGNKAGIAGYQRQVPEVDGSITVLDTDLQLINLLLYGTATLSGEEWALGQSCPASTTALSVQLLDPCDDIAPYTVLKEYYLDDIEITGDAHSVNVNGNVQIAYNFKSKTGRLVVFSGAKP